MAKWWWLSVVWLVACGPQVRAPGERQPLSAPCDALDPTRCLLPWPSNVYTVAEASSPTGLRVSISPGSLPQRDAVAPLNRLDGFSVATPLLVGFPARLDPALSGQRRPPSVRLFVAQGERFGEEVPLRLHVVDDGDASSASVLIAYPLRPLAFDTDYVAAVLDDVRSADGARFLPGREVQVAMGATAASTEAEQQLFRYHAPARAVLARAGLEPRRVLRVWDFTTRSAEAATGPFHALRTAALDAVAARRLTVAITQASPRGDGGVEVLGTVGGLPSFVSDAGLALDGAPSGVHEVPFRVVLPGGTAGPLPLVLYGHGTGGAVTDQALDDDILSTGAGKLNLEFTGWTRASVPSTFLGFEKVLSGSERSTARLTQSLVDASALQAALTAQLGEALAAPTLAGVTNPFAGRRFDPTRVAWVGSSLGGTLGFAHALQEPSLAAAVLNVPGAGCTQFLQHAEQWQQLDAVFAVSLPSAIDRALALAIAQTSWDLVDGASWSAAPARPTPPLLIQESMGDVVLPNLGSELVASAAGAAHLGRVLAEVEGVAPATETSGPSLTQYRVPAALTDTGDVHAFLTKPTVAGAAAREQLRDFLRSVWSGAPRATEPALCRANASSCDFSAAAP